MLRDIEVENGGEAPRIHSMDEYFMTEVEKVSGWFLKLIIILEGVISITYVTRYTYFKYCVYIIG